MNILNVEPSDFSHRAKFLYISGLNRGGYEEAFWHELPEDCTHVDVLIVRLERYIGREALSYFPNLKYVISATTGTDHLDLKYLEQRKIKFFCLKGETDFLRTITSTPELTWGLLISLLRHIPQAVSSVHQEWNRDKFKGYQLKGKTIGIIGLGRVGWQIALYAKAFGMEIMYYDPFVVDDSFQKCVSLDELLHKSDIVTVHVHLTDETDSLLNEDNLHKMKKGAYLINTSRGRIIDEATIVSLLKQNHLKGVAVDVLGDELQDYKSSLLYQAFLEGYNVLITPHIGGASYDAMHMCEEFMAKKFIDFIKDCI